MELDVLELRPLSARSVVLSTLLGSHPPQLPARGLVLVGELFGIAEGTIRVAISRMVAAGDLIQDGGAYRLSDRLLQRQARQDESLWPRTRSWRGAWQIAVVTAERRTAADRVALRTAMTGLRLAELREGTWLRPANLVLPRPSIVDDQCTMLEGKPEDDGAELAATLWDLDTWAHRARLLHAALDRAAGPAEGFTVSAAVLRHLLADPLLPAQLLPDGWPGNDLRQRYEEFAASFRNLLRQYISAA